MLCGELVSRLLNLYVKLPRLFFKPVAVYTDRSGELVSTLEGRDILPVLVTLYIFKARSQLVTSAEFLSDHVATQPFKLVHSLTRLRVHL
jgi:hypothetical protein